MSKLRLISTFQCGKLLGKKVPEIRTLLQDRKIDYVRDEHLIYKVSLDSLLSYARENQLAINEPYLTDLEAKLCPWYQDKQGFYATQDTNTEDDPEEEEDQA